MQSNRTHMFSEQISTSLLNWQIQPSCCDGCPHFQTISFQAALAWDADDESATVVVVNVQAPTGPWPVAGPLDIILQGFGDGTGAGITARTTAEQLATPSSNIGESGRSSQRATHQDYLQK